MRQRGWLFALALTLSFGVSAVAEIRHQDPPPPGSGAGGGGSACSQPQCGCSAPPGFYVCGYSCGCGNNGQLQWRNCSTCPTP